MKVFLGVAVGFFIASITYLFIENQKLRAENRHLIEVSSRIQTTNRGFEASLVSCRLTLDSMVSEGQRLVVSRANTDIRQYSHLYQRRFMRVARAAGLGDSDGVLQAGQ